MIDPIPTYLDRLIFVRSKIIGFYQKNYLTLSPATKRKLINVQAELYKYIELYYHNTDTGRKAYNRKYNRFKFRFNVTHHPDLFDIKKLKKVGWYKPSKNNKNGLSRDHIVSVKEAIKNNYDPYYITHPVNCALIPFPENSRKGNKSSMSYETLIKKVKEYDSFGRI